MLLDSRDRFPPSALPRVARSSGPGAILARLAPLLLLASLLAPVPVSAVQFQPLAELATGIGFTTVIELGPEDPDPGATGDGCLYAVNGGAGAVHRICFEDAPGGTAKQVTSTTVGGTPVIDLNGGGGTNNVLGITVDPAAPSGEIHLYLGYSDDNSAPFAGKIARAVSTDSGQSYVVDEDFITGLARSAFDHQTNGLDFGPDGCLYITQGNNSNAGYDSAFAESFYSSAILRVCFKTPSGAVDPSVDRDCGSGNLQEACDVEIYASGQRNPSTWSGTRTAASTPPTTTRTPASVTTAGTRPTTSGAPARSRR